MSKRLPYYQSEPGEYLAGDIMFCSFASQGVFTILRALYWQKDCEITLTQAKKRILNAEEEFQELISENIIKIQEDYIIINFLDEQYNNATKKSKTNSENGKLGAKKRWAKIAKNSESIATPSIRYSESIAFKEDNIKEKKIKEDNIKKIYDLYPSKCPISKRATGKTSKDKEKIKKLGSLVSEELVRAYIEDCKKTNTFIKNFSTFLNNLPSIEDLKDINVEKQNKILDSKPILYFCTHKFKSQRFIEDENGLNELKKLVKHQQIMDLKYEKVSDDIYDKVLAKFVQS